MPYFLTNQPIIINQGFTLQDAEARHLMLSHRVKIGEKVKIQDSVLNRFLCEVVQINKKAIELKALEVLSTPPEPIIKLTLCIANISEQALDIILTKATELGASNIIIFQAENSPHNLKNKAESKLGRWTKICQESAKQSERVKSPHIQTQPDLENTFKTTENYDSRYFLDFTEKSKQTSLSKKVNSVAVFIGPEGGWSDNERLTAKKQVNLEILQLGPRTLKTETAALAILAILQFNLGDL